MDESKARKYKTGISERAVRILGYAEACQVACPRDERELAGIYSMMIGIDSAISRIEASRRRREMLEIDLARMLAEMEDGCTKFADRRSLPARTQRLLELHMQEEGKA